MPKRRGLRRKHAQLRKLETAHSLTPLDYCMMVSESELSDQELSEVLEISLRTVKRMRKLDYMPDEVLIERIRRKMKIDRYEDEI